MISKREKARRSRTLPSWYQRGMLTATGFRAYLLNLRLVFMMGWKSSLLLAGVIAYRRYSGMPAGFIDWILIGFIAMPVPIALLSTLGTDIEAQMSGLAVRGRWDEVFSLVPKYRKKLCAALGTPRGTVGTCLWKARAHTRLGNADLAAEAIDEIRRTEGTTDADFLSVRGQIESLAGDSEQARITAQELIEVAPERIEGWLLVIEIDAMYFGDALSARLALDEAMSQEWWSNFGPMMDYPVGITLAAEGEHDAAVEHLDAFRVFARDYAARLPMSWALWAMAGCVLADSHRSLGDTAQAETVMNEIDDVIRDNGFDEIAFHVDRYVTCELPA